MLRVELLSEEVLSYIQRPAGNGLGGEGSLTSALDLLAGGRRADGMPCPFELLCGEEFVSTRRPAGNGLGGEGSLASASEPSVVRRRGDGVRGSIVSLGEESSVSTRRPAGNGRGGEGSAASFSLSVGKRDRGSLFSSVFPPSIAYCGTGRGGDGSCETGTVDDVGTRVGRAIHHETRTAATRKRTEYLMVMLR